MKSSQAMTMTKHDLMYLQELRAMQIQKYQRQHQALSACRTTLERIAMRTLHAIENVWDV